MVSEVECWGRMKWVVESMNVGLSAVRVKGDLSMQCTVFGSNQARAAARSAAADLDLHPRHAQHLLGAIEAPAGSSTEPRAGEQADR
jgi:hypothetical protein